MRILVELIAAVLLVTGGLTVALAAVGVARLPDALTRMHAATKAGALGAGLLLLGAGLALGGFSTIATAFAGIVFLYATAPIAAHVLGRAAYIEAFGREPTPGDLSEIARRALGRRPLRRLRATRPTDPPLAD